MAATRNTNYYELLIVHPSYNLSAPPVYASGYADGLDAINEDGTIPVPNDPRLDIE